MDADWIRSPEGRRVVELWNDARPAWLWSQDGQTLIWRNRAARLFLGRVKRKGLKLVPELTPIRGQVARIIRLGSIGRASLSRIQFLAGEKPVSVTCSCTPLALPEGPAALLIAGVDAIDKELWFADPGEDALSRAILPPGAEYLVASPGGEILDGSAEALRRIAPEFNSGSGDGEARIWDDRFAVTRLKASGDGASLLLFEGIGEARADELPPTPTPPREGEGGDVAPPLTQEVDDGALPPVRDDPVIPEDAERVEDFLTAGWFEDEVDTGVATSPPSPLRGEVRGGGDSRDPAPMPAEADDAATPVAEMIADNGRRLSSLFDRLASDEQLYAPLGDIDETPTQAPAPAEPAEAATVGEMADVRAAIEGIEAEPAPVTPTLFKVTGRGFVALAVGAPVEPVPAPVVAPDEPQGDPEVVERVSRYNFDELGRILTDRIGIEANAANGPVSIPTGAAPATIEAIIAQTEPATPVPVAPAATGALVNLGGETLVLNRLPLGILVFRDQQVLFANRAITEMTGYDSVEALRNAGLASIFPASDNTEEAGPINHIVQRDGALVPVTARLQSISWQGRPALMLSASATEVRTGHEIAVRAFAEAFAEARGDGFVEANKAGVISQVSAQGRIALEMSEQQLLGRPLSGIIDAAEGETLREFLARPARFAETARPCLSVKTTVKGVDFLLFAQGQAGVVTGYFGFLRRQEPSRELLAPRDGGEGDPALLARLSRSVRRPLNTIIGFSDLIRSAAFGPVENPRYLEYAQDIKTAGHEIAALVDELDDYARLKDGRYAPRHADLDLAGLLESCVTRVRGQAGAARVLVRSAISAQLPKITADRASLGQAVLNLLSSAIDQTPVGGSVVLSAQLEDDGTVSVHVRDSASTTGDLSERFVVFRDGVGRNGEALAPVRSSVGLALTRSLLAVNAFSLSVAPTGGTGTLFSLVIPADLVAQG